MWGGSREKEGAVLSQCFKPKLHGKKGNSMARKETAAEISASGSSAFTKISSGTKLSTL
jgi:hypothetical protein